MSTLQILAVHRAVLAEVAAGTVTYDIAGLRYLIGGQPNEPLAVTLRELFDHHLLRLEVADHEDTVYVRLTDAGERVIA